MLYVTYIKKSSLLRELVLNVLIQSLGKDATNEVLLITWNWNCVDHSVYSSFTRLLKKNFTELNHSVSFFDHYNAPWSWIAKFAIEGQL